MHHVSQTLSTSDDDACKTLNEVKVVNLVTVTTLTRSMVVTRHIINDVLVRARYAYAPRMHSKSKASYLQLEWHPQHQN